LVVSCVAFVPWIGPLSPALDLASYTRLEGAFSMRCCTAPGLFSLFYRWPFGVARSLSVIPKTCIFLTHSPSFTAELLSVQYCGGLAFLDSGVAWDRLENLPGSVALRLAFFFVSPCLPVSEMMVNRDSGFLFHIPSTLVLACLLATSPFFFTPHFSLLHVFPNQGGLCSAPA